MITLQPGEVKQANVALTPTSPWILPAGASSSDPNWYVPRAACDGSLNTRAYYIYATAPDAYTPFIEFLCGGTRNIMGFKVYLGRQPWSLSQNIPQGVDIDITSDGITWVDMVEETITGGQWVELYLPNPVLAVKVRLRIRNVLPTSCHMAVIEFMLGVAPLPILT